MDGMTIECEGLLFIGDPQLTARRPGRRKDKDFSGAILGKIAQSMEIANERRLLPIFLGDMFDRAVERDESLKTRLMRILGTCWTKPFSNVGNHDMQGLRLADADSLSLFAVSSLIHIVDGNGPAAEAMIGGYRVGLGFTPYGQRIPHDAGSLFPEADAVVWMTHADIAFDGLFPGGIAPFEISGCSLVVNGHDHHTKQPVVVGQTMWFNPGNITRLSVDMIGHVPTVWQFSPHLSADIVPHELRHEKDVFDLVGRLIDDVSPEGDDQGSAFVDILSAEVEAGPAATQDGTLLLEEMRRRFEANKTPPEIRSYMMELFNGATAEVA